MITNCEAVGFKTQHAQEDHSSTEPFTVVNAKSLT